MVENEITIERGEHTLHLNYKRNNFFSFSFFFLYLKKNVKIGGIWGRGREPVMYYER
jgi:hypothetical protein